MLPIVLDVTELTIAIIGSGPQARRRLQMADALHASLDGTIEFVEQKHFPHGDANELQIFLPLEPL